MFPSLHTRAGTGPGLKPGRAEDFDTHGRAAILLKAGPCIEKWSPVKFTGHQEGDFDINILNVKPLAFLKNKIIQ